MRSLEKAIGALQVLPRTLTSRIQLGPHLSWVIPSSLLAFFQGSRGGELAMKWTPHIFRNVHRPRIISIEFGHPTCIPIAGVLRDALSLSLTHLLCFSTSSLSNSFCLLQLFRNLFTETRSIANHDLGTNFSAGIKHHAAPPF